MMIMVMVVVEEEEEEHGIYSYFGDIEQVHCIIFKLSYSGRYVSIFHLWKLSQSLRCWQGQDSNPVSRSSCPSSLFSSGWVFLNKLLRLLEPLLLYMWGENNQFIRLLLQSNKLICVKQKHRALKYHRSHLVNHSFPRTSWKMFDHSQ